MSCGVPRGFWTTVITETHTQKARWHARLTKGPERSTISLHSGIGRRSTAGVQTEAREQGVFLRDFAGNGLLLVAR